MAGNSRRMGRRYEEPKLNMKKVFAVVLACAVIIMSIFTIVRLLTNGSTSISADIRKYFPIYKDEKWGIIDNNGEIVITPAYEEMIMVPDSSKDIFLCTYDVDYNTGTYMTKVLNSDNKEIFTAYENIEAISNSYKNNQMWYEEDVLKISKNGKCGLIDLSGKELLNIEYDSIEVVPGIKDILKVKKENKCGIINLEGKQILDINYLEISLLGKDSKSGFIVKNDQNLYGIINYSGEVGLECKYENIDKIVGKNLFVIREQGKQKVINSEGEYIIQEGYDEIISILNNGEGIICKKGDKYGIININNEIKIDFLYEDLKETKDNLFIAKENNKYGVIDLNKNIKIEFKYNKIEYSKDANIYIAENIDYTNEFFNSKFELKQTGYLVQINTEKAYLEIRQDEEYKYYDYNFNSKEVEDIYIDNTLYISKKDSKYGFVDKDGNIVVDYIYDDATKQNEFGFAGIKKDGRWGSIDKNGNIIQQPIYNLDEYLIIDFIGRWHYGMDLNMNYYNQI